MAATVVTLLPPPQYDVAPSVPVIEHVLSREEVQKVCGGLDRFRTVRPGEFYRGCTLPPKEQVFEQVYGPKSGIVTVNGHIIGLDLVRSSWGAANWGPPLNKRVCEVWRIDDELVRRHEIGHCNGWPHDHPGGR